ncbi:hypothetical protein ACE3MQ_23185 [Paenibacillus lentus]
MNYGVIKFYGALYHTVEKHGGVEMGFSPCHQSLRKSRIKLLADIHNDKVQNILFQSAEFNAINNALHNGSALEDL